jgi:outer membrane protein OmpA-like peptidoglycan-associated protein
MTRADYIRAVTDALAKRLGHATPFAEHLAPDIDRACLGLKPVHLRSLSGLLFMCLADNPPADYSSEPLPPPSTVEEAPDSGMSIPSYSDTSVSDTMNEEDAALRSALGQWGVIPARNGDNLIVGLDSDRLFEGDSANLTAQGRDMVISLSRVAKRYPSTYVNVDGFTDTNGERQANMMISQERADAVADVLSDQGVESRRLSAVGHGEDFPKVPTGAGVAEPKNRRVEITLEPYAG